MKKLIGPMAVAVLLCAVLLFGYKQKSGNALPTDYPLDLLFTSGAGAWGTCMTLESDGAFAGEYHDTDMGDSGEGYPNGTVYVCSFSGRFEDFTQINRHSYSLTLVELSSDYEEGKEWFEGGVRYVSAEPYGVEDGREFILFLPDTPTSELSETFLSWWPGRFSPETQKDTLSVYGLYNVKMGYGFFAEPHLREAETHNFKK